jgi:hypothetical protein
MDIEAHIGFQAQQGHGKNSSEKAIDVAETHDKPIAFWEN